MAKKRLRRILLIVLAVVVVLVVTLFLLLDAIVESRLKSEFAERFGLDLEVESVSISAWDGAGTLSGVKVRELGRTVFEASEMRAEVAVRDAIGGTIDVRKVRVVRPVLRVEMEPGGQTNIQRILAAARRRELARARAEPAAPGPPGIVVLRDVLVVNGRVEFTDSIVDPKMPMHVVVDELDVSVRELQVAGTPVTASWGDARVDAVLRQPQFPARISLAAWVRPVQGKPTFVAHLAVTGLDLRAFPQYVSATDRTALGSDVLHLTASFDVREGSIALGAIAGEVVGTGAVLPLVVGGTIDAPVFDKTSALASALKVPLGHVGHVGEVTVGAAWSVLKGGAGGVSQVGGGVVDAGGSVVGGVGGAAEGLAHGDPFGALQAAGGGVFGGVKSIGSGVYEGVKSIFGGGTNAAQSLAGIHPEDINAEFAKVHALRRRRMIEAALASVPEGVEERRRRILAELSTLPRDEPPGQPPR